MYDNLTFAEDARGLVWACRLSNLDPENPPPSSAAFPVLLPGGEFHNLFAASLLMYKVSKDVQAAIESLIEYSEAKGNDEVVNSLLTLASGLRISTNAAEKGLRSALT